jgi:NPCBM/NEW2 domain
MTRLALAAIAALHAALALAAPPVDVLRADGQRVRGELRQSHPALVLLTESGVVEIDWPTVMEVQTVPPPSVAAAAACSTGLRFELVDGSRFCGRVASAAEATVDVTLADDQRARFAPAALRRIVQPHAAARGDSPSPEAAQQDRVIVSNGQKEAVIDGVLVRVEADGALFRWKERERLIRWDVLVDLRLARPLDSPAAALVHLRRGDRFAGRIVAGDAEHITLRSSAFDSLKLAWTEIERIECSSDQTTFVSAMQPLAYEFEALLGRRWELGLDRSLLGGSLRIGGREIPRGIAMHSRARVAYSAGGFRRFVASVGIDAAAGRQGDAAVAVLGDGKVLFQEVHVRSGDEPREVSVDLDGVRVLELVVEYGADLDLGDHVIWGMARLVR